MRFRDIKNPLAIRSGLVSLALLLLTILAFSPILQNGFISYDDQIYIFKNARVLSGLSAGNIIWAFTTVTAANWHPLAWLSHMCDVELFGLNAHGHHLTSLILHAANALLLFLVLRSASGHMLRSAFVAALFALHPLHVESVAWVAERKDVLSGFFWCLGMAMYLRYARRPKYSTYLLMIFAFALGLLSKPMLVSFPFVLLLLDYWPLGRWVGSRAMDRHGSGSSRRYASGIKLLIEKIPLFVLAAGDAAMTYFAQERGGSVAHLLQLKDSFAVTFPNVPLAYVGYLQKMIWPSNLAVFYPHQTHGVVSAHWIAAIIFLTSITAGVLWKLRALPYLAVGWLWYIISLIPVSGLLQVGSQAMADRYTYLPLVGIFIGLTWGVPQMLVHVPGRITVLCTLSCAIVIMFTFLSFRQSGFWKNDMTLFTHAVEVTDGNWLAHSILGRYFFDNGNMLLTVEHYTKAIESRPNFPSPLFYLGIALQRLGRFDQALEQFRALVVLKPDMFAAYYNMGTILFRQGKCKESTEQFQNALRLNPDDAEARSLLTMSLSACRDQK